MTYAKRSTTWRIQDGNIQNTVSNKLYIESEGGGPLPSDSNIA